MIFRSLQDSLTVSLVKCPFWCYYIDSIDSKSVNVNALEGTFNKEKTLLGVFSGIVYLVSISKLRNSNLQLSRLHCYLSWIWTNWKMWKCDISGRGSVGLICLNICSQIEINPEFLLPTDTLHTFCCFLAFLLEIGARYKDQRSMSFVFFSIFYTWNSFYLAFSKILLTSPTLQKCPEDFLK